MINTLELIKTFVILLTIIDPIGNIPLIIVLTENKSDHDYKAIILKTCCAVVILLSISFYAKSFKEAQSLVTPINILILFPALIGLIPGIELNWKTALIPIVNIALVTKEIIAETVSGVLLLEVYGSMIILAVVGLFFTRWWFNREEVIFRG